MLKNVLQCAVIRNVDIKVLSKSRVAVLAAYSSNILPKIFPI